MLITGGAGFIGFHLFRKLIGKGSLVDIIDKRIPAWPVDEFDADYTLYFAIDIIGEDFTAYLRKTDYDYIFHLAGSASVQLSVKRPFTDFETNLRGTLNLLETLRTVDYLPKLIYLSSAAVYGNPVRSPISEEDATVPISPYGISKLAAERYLHVYSEIHGLPAVSVRPFSVYGPGQGKQVVFDIIRKIENNPKKLELFGTGMEARDFIYISDIVDALLIVAEKSNMTGEVYNLASGKSVEISEIAEEICRITGVSPQMEYKGSVRPGVPLVWEANIGKLKALGFRPAIEMHEGLRKTIEWFIETKTDRR